mmetsp:Transcript_16942/g.30352  ORF Transcript_16942/g.30352 Transcript_16942/m.30352 type:complete len:201 (-) Transcript_16942:127-729(-)
MRKMGSHNNNQAGFNVEIGADLGNCRLIGHPYRKPSTFSRLLFQYLARQNPVTVGMLIQSARCTPTKTLHAYTSESEAQPLVEGGSGGFVKRAAEDREETAGDLLAPTYSTREETAGDLLAPNWEEDSMRTSRRRYDNEHQHPQQPYVEADDLDVNMHSNAHDGYGLDSSRMMEEQQRQQHQIQEASAASRVMELDVMEE